MKPLDGTGLKRLHREWRRRTPGRLALAARRAGHAGQRRARSCARAAAYRVEEIWLAGATPDLTVPGVQRTALGTDRYLTARPDRHRGGGRSPPPTLRATGWSASSWPTPPCPCTSWPSRPMSASPSVTRTTAWPRPRWPPATTSPTSRCSGGSARSTWPRPAPSRCTRCAAGPGRVRAQEPRSRTAAPAPREAPAPMRKSEARSKRSDGHAEPRAAQIRRGSTSTRNRPAGRGVAARASHSAACVGARSSHRPSAGPRTSTPSGRSRASHEGRPRPGLTRGQGGGRREAQRLPPRQLVRGQAPGIGVQHGVEHLVVGQPGLHQDAARRRCGRRPAGRLGPGGRTPARRPGSGGRAARRRSRGRPRRRPTPPGGARPRCRRSTRASGSACPAVAAVTSTTAVPASALPAPRATGTRPAGSCGTFPRPHCWHTTGRSAPHRRQRSTWPSRLVDGGLAHARSGRSSPQAAQASSRARPSGVEHAHDPRAARGGGAASGDERSEGVVQGRPRGRGRRSRGSASRRARRCGCGTEQPAPAERLERRARATTSTQGSAGAPGPLDDDVAGVPGRRPLLLQRLVVLVEHDGRRPARRPAPTPPPGPRPRRRPRRRPSAQSRGWSATASPARRSRAASSRAWSTDGVITERGADARRRRGRRRSGRPSAGGAARPARRPARQRRRGQRVERLRDPGRPATGGGSPATAPGGDAVDRNAT